MHKGIYPARQRRTPARPDPLHRPGPFTRSTKPDEQTAVVTLGRTLAVSLDTPQNLAATQDIRPSSPSYGGQDGATSCVFESSVPNALDFSAC